MLSNKVAVGLIALVALGGAAGTGVYLASRQPVSPANASVVTPPSTTPSASGAVEATEAVMDDKDAGTKPATPAPATSAPLPATPSPAPAATPHAAPAPKPRHAESVPVVQAKSPAPPKAPATASAPPPGETRTAQTQPAAVPPATPSTQVHPAEPDS